MFRAELLSSQQTSWEDLFARFTTLQAITFSSSIKFLLRLAVRLDAMELVFGSESILSEEHPGLAQASRTIQTYGFAGAPRFRLRRSRPAKWRPTRVIQSHLGSSIALYSDRRTPDGMAGGGRW